MKRIICALMITILCVCLTACKTESENTETNVTALSQPTTVSTEIEDGHSFSFEEVKSIYTEEEAGVHYEGFVNTEKTECKSPEQAIELAKKECKGEYNAIAVSYDSIEKVYRVEFYTKLMADDCFMVGGGFDVYISEEGITLLTVAEE